jgi:methionine sulfoxide reductase heme-binding subunit
MRRPLVLGVAIAIALLVVIDAIAARAGLVTGAMPRPDGPWIWIASRAAGVTAFVALTLDVAFGLLLSTGVADRWIARARSVEIHRWLSSSTLVLVGAHALSLAGDRFVRFDVLDAFVPFIAPYRAGAVGVGVIAAWIALAVHVSFGLRKRIGASVWRRLHYLSFVTFGLAAAHGLLAGSDAARPWGHALYLGAVGVVATLSLVRVALALGKPARAVIAP